MGRQSLDAWGPKKKLKKKQNCWLQEGYIGMEDNVIKYVKLSVRLKKIWLFER